jgi:hypothetical protein
MRKFIAEWGYGRPTGYYAEVEINKDEFIELEKAIAWKEIAGGRFYSRIETIELENGMKLHAEGSVDYIKINAKRKNENRKWRG